MIKESVYKLLEKGIFKDEHPIYKGLPVKYEKVDGTYMVTINNGETWLSLYEKYEEGLKVYSRMINKMTKEDIYKFRMEKCKMVHRDIWDKITIAEDQGENISSLNKLMEKNLGLIMHLKAKEIKEVKK